MVSRVCKPSAQGPPSGGNIERVLCLAVVEYIDFRILGIDQRIARLQDTDLLNHY